MSAFRFSDIQLKQADPDQALRDFLFEVSNRSTNTPRSYRFINIYNVAYASQNEAYAAILKREGVNHPDGWPLAALARITTKQTCYHIRGPGFFSAALSAGRASNIRHFFLGGDQELLDRVVTAATSRFPGLIVAGAFAPPFRPMTELEREDQDTLIRNAAPDIVWVALGTPKQEIEAARITSATGLPTAAVGAAFDFLAGTKPEAPIRLRQYRLEWLFRLATEPRRLWPRYYFAATRFAYLALREIIRRPLP